MSRQLESILNKVTTATPAAKAKSVQEPMPSADVVPMPAQIPSAEATQAATPAKAAEPQKSLQAYVPASVDRAVRLRAAEEGTTTRTLLLRGLKAIGFDVPEEELRDKRGRP